MCQERILLSGTLALADSARNAVPLPDTSGMSGPVPSSAPSALCGGGGSEVRVPRDARAGAVTAAAAQLWGQGWELLFFFRSTVSSEVPRDRHRPRGCPGVGYAPARLRSEGSSSVDGLGTPDTARGVCDGRWVTSPPAFGASLGSPPANARPDRARGAPSHRITRRARCPLALPRCTIIALEPRAGASKAYVECSCSRTRFPSRP